jgi:hypothetical protein
MIKSTKIRRTVNGREEKYIQNVVNDKVVPAMKTYEGVKVYLHHS